MHRHPEPTPPWASHLIRILASGHPTFVCSTRRVASIHVIFGVPPQVRVGNVDAMSLVQVWASARRGRVTSGRNGRRDWELVPGVGSTGFENSFLSVAAATSNRTVSP